MNKQSGQERRPESMPPTTFPGRHIYALCIGLIRFYQLFISPLFPAACRYTPTCSQYALDAITEHGPVRGLMFAVGRILRCHPFAAGGYDPVRPASRREPESR